MKSGCVRGSLCVGSTLRVRGEGLGEGDEIGLRGSCGPVCTGRQDLCVQWWKAFWGIGSLSVKVSVI